MKKYFVRVYRDCVYEVEIEASSKTDAYSKLVDEITENGLSNLYFVDESFDYEISRDDVDEDTEQLTLKDKEEIALRKLAENDIDEWFDENDWLIPDDGGYECYGCDCWRENEGCVQHMKGKTCWNK